MRLSRWLGLAVAGALLAGLARADVTGTVTIKGAPASTDETFLANARGCGDSSVRHTENWKIGPHGELADVVVWIVDPRLPPGTPPAPEQELKQIGCRYEPHVLALAAGTPLRIVNGDPTLHNVLARFYDLATQTPGDTLFNLGQSYRGQVDERQFDAPGVYTLQCNVHSWMQAWVRVLPSACGAVTGTDGHFQIPQSDRLPDGPCRLAAWHPKFAAPLEQVIQVKNGTATVTFRFDGPKSL